MKILMVNKFLYPVGGAESYMLALGEHLVAMGNEVQYFGMYDKRNIVGNEIDAYTRNVDYRAANNKQRIMSLFDTIYSRNARKQIKKLLEKFQPDIVHLNNINFQITPSIIYEIKAAKIPVVQTVHDVQIVCPCHRFYIEHSQKICTLCVDRHFYHCIKNKCIQGSVTKSSIAAIESYFYHMRDTYNLVDRYICPSKFMSDQLLRSGINACNITILNNFTDSFLPIRAKRGKKYALYFGRLSVEKGIRTLMKVCCELDYVNFVIAGSGPLESEVAAFAKEKKNVDFVGYKSGEELDGLIANALFSIYPSEWYENCPLSVLESQALGTPVIASDFGGTPELIENNKTGIIYKGRDEQELKNAITRLWKDYDLLQYMRKNCNEKHFINIEEYGEIIKKIYKDL